MSSARIARIAREFGGSGAVGRLPGGMGATWNATSPGGAIVLKPAPHPDEARWLGETFGRLTFGLEVRVPRPVASREGAWIVDDHVAWSWLDGATTEGRYDQKIGAARAFHAALRHEPRPGFVDRRLDPWAKADRVAWGEAPSDYDADTMAVLAPVLALAGRNPVPDSCAPQLVHADLSGNYVLAEGQVPGIIDVTLYWRPEGFAEAVVWVDTIWFSATSQPEAFRRPGIGACVLRALARRIAEQPEQVAAGMKSASEAAGVVANLARATPKLLEPWDLA